MADQVITRQELIDAQKDAATLKEVINEDDQTDVEARLGEVYPSLSKAMRLIVENGLLGATPFATSALMHASVLADESYAVVTDDKDIENKPTSLNGFYQKVDGVWTFLAWNPLSQWLAELNVLKDEIHVKSINANQAIHLHNNNQLKNYDYANSEAQSLSMLTVGIGSYLEIPQLKSFSAWRSGTTSFPSSVMLIDNESIALTATKKALKVRVVRSNNGTNRTDLQLRQIIKVPDYLYNLTNVPVTLVFAYKIDSLDVLPQSTGLLVSANADMSNPILINATKLSTDVIGEWALATFTANFDAASNRYIVFGHRIGANANRTNDYDGYAYLGAAYVGFNRADKISGFETNRFLEIERHVANVYGGQLFTSVLNGDNALKNAVLTQGNQNFNFLHGAAGTVLASYSIEPSIDLPYTIDASVLKTQHYNNGVVRTDGQQQQIVNVPKALLGKPFKVKAMQTVRRNSNHIAITLFVNQLNSSAISVAAATINPVVPLNVLNEWMTLQYEFEVTDLTVTQLDMRFRTLVNVTSGVIDTLTAEQTMFYVGFNKPDALKVYDRNLDFDIEAKAKAVVSDALSSITNIGVVSESDLYIDANNQHSLVVPAKDIVLLGDSQTANLESRMTSAFVDRQVKIAGIGGEWSSHILNRLSGHILNIAGLNFTTSGTKRLKTKRAVPPRSTSEAYRNDWNSLSVKTAELRFVNFYNKDGLIGTSYTQHKVNATVSGTTLTANNHGFANGDEVYILSDNRPSNMYKGKVYYVTSATASTFELKEFNSGSSVSFASFTGNIEVLGGFYLDWAFSTDMNTDVYIQTYTNFDECVLVYSAGTNDIGNDVPVDVIKANIDLTISQIKTMFKRWVFHSIPMFYWETSDTAQRYDKIREINTYVKQKYPRNYVDTIAPLQAAGDGSANDNADIAAGLIPRSLRIASNDGHINGTGNDIRVAVIKNFIEAKSW